MGQTDKKKKNQPTNLRSSVNPKKDKYIENNISVYHSQMLNSKNKDNNLKSNRRKALFTCMGSAIRRIAAVSSETMETQS